MNKYKYILFSHLIPSIRFLIYIITIVMVIRTTATAMDIAREKKLNTLETLEK